MVWLWYTEDGYQREIKWVILKADSTVNNLFGRNSAQE